MYEINNETETLVRSTDLCIKRKGKRTFNFRLHETIAPVVDDKYVVFPVPLIDAMEVKAKYIVRGNNETDVINEFIALTRSVKKINSMFIHTEQDHGE